MLADTDFLDLLTPRKPSVGAVHAFLPAAPKTLADAGLSEEDAEALMLKYLLHGAAASGRQISEQIKLPFSIVTEALRQLKADQVVSYRNSSGMNDYIYVLTDVGYGRARRYAEQNTYFGAAPVPLADYSASVVQQSPRREQPTARSLRQALHDLSINEELFGQIGLAVSSCSAMFLYGDPGNGKTSIAERITAAFGSTIWIPRAVWMDGEVMRIYDPTVHETVDGQAENDGAATDARWVKVKRPTIIVGGEMTMSHLDIQQHSASGIVEAPMHIKSNGGTLVIDDFGRQRAGTREILNRWIVPLEKHYEFLTSPHGKKIQLPFEQMLVFATNLDPAELVDEAFLRRIPYKIRAQNPSDAEFHELFRKECDKAGIAFSQPSFEHLLRRYFAEPKREKRYCHPRDVVRQILNFCRFYELPLQMTPDAVDCAGKNYFAATSTKED